VAAISHLPLVVAAALVESVAGGVGATRSWPVARTLAASGWRDMTRLAKGDPVMGADILATNADALRERLIAMRDALDGWIEQLDGGAPDPDQIRERLQRARDTLAEGTP
jgi:prephenate dehydrogenase